MENLKQSIEKAEGLTKVIVSKPANKSKEYKKIVVEVKANGYQISKYTEKQVFHENIKANQLGQRLSELAADYRQINAWSKAYEHIWLISKDGSFTYKKKADNNALKGNGQNASAQNAQGQNANGHNRTKNYLIPEGEKVPPLVDMGIFTKDGKVVKSMYDKYKQINRFLEILDDEIGKQKLSSLNVIDFGCGKSYLTFVVYYYLTEIKKIDAHIIGLDLKADVIKKCNAAAQKYGYSNLKFELGDINGYKTPFDVDMVLTLHACDTATDYALYNAIQWKAKMIFSVPCCQHELNGQMKTDNLSILTRYGIVKERFAALATDAIRGNLLEYSGYKTQLLEFVDLEHTPKNILIRAVKRPVTPKAVITTSLREVESLMAEFGVEPTLHRLLLSKND